MKRLIYGGGVLLAIALGMTSRAWAHGSTIKFRATEAIEVQATYDDGKPMGEAQVTVYAPDDPATPWLQGVTDPQGRFTFTPDRDQPGNWEVKVRQAGHGDIASIPVAAEESAVEPSDAAASAEATAASPEEPASDSSDTAVTQAGWSGGSYTPMQKLVMAASGIWGFVGTALFFARRKD